MACLMAPTPCACAVARLDGNYDEKEINGLLVVNTRPIDTPTPDATPTVPEPPHPDCHPNRPLYADAGDGTAAANCHPHPTGHRGR